MARMHMTKLPCNYKNKAEDDTCVLCGEDEIRTEHYYTCEGTMKLRKLWNTTEKDLESACTADLSRTTKFLESVASRLQPAWRDISKSDLKQHKEHHKNKITKQ